MKTRVLKQTVKSIFFRTMARALFVAATKQHIGKTSTCSGLVAGLKERFKNVGYIKPVGQQHVPVETKEGTTIRVDKDVRLFKEFFDLNHIEYPDMSPLIVPSGYTRDFLDGKVSSQTQHDTIKRAYDAVAARSDFTVIEGTGHCGVGSIIEMDNAKVASLLGVDMVLVCDAGIGSSFDELELNRLVCNQYGVRIKGVVLNRVQPEKLEDVKTYMTKALRKWNVPVCGLIPWNPYLDSPTMMDFELLFKARLVSGQKNRLRHFNMRRLMATSLNRFTNVIGMEAYSRTLWVTHGSRRDLLMVLVDHARSCKAQGGEWLGGLILAGADETSGSTELEQEDIIKALKETDTPVLIVKDDVTRALSKVSKYVAKLSPDDQSRTRAAVQHIKSCLDFDLLLA